MLRGGPGADDLSGGDGIDTADYELSARVTVTLDDQANDGSPGEKDNVRTDVENVEGGGDEDTFTGSNRGNRLDGAAGEDYIDGETGADQLLGGGSIDVLRARDGSRDVVTCGRAKDLAIVDPVDEVARNCEFQSGLRPRATLGEDVVVEPAGGAQASQDENEAIQFGLPGMQRTVPLKERLELPVRSEIDATKASVKLVGAGNRSAGAGRKRRGRRGRGGRHCPDGDGEGRPLHRRAEALEQAAAGAAASPSHRRRLPSKPER